jgi:flagellar biosynthesis regulator FlbT
MEKVNLILDPGEKGLVGKMALTNIGRQAVRLRVQGEGPVLREKQMIRAKQATTPALKVYYMLQNMYLDPSSFEKTSKAFLDLTRELVNQVPSTGMIMSEIGEFLIAGDFKKAFEKSYDLLRYEELLSQTVSGKTPKAKGKAKPKARPKAKAKPKAKKTTAKPKAKAKAKAKPKAKPKLKLKVRAKKRR